MSIVDEEGIECLDRVFRLDYVPGRSPLRGLALALPTGRKLNFYNKNLII